MCPAIEQKGYAGEHAAEAQGVDPDQNPMRGQPIYKSQSSLERCGEMWPVVGGGDEGSPEVGPAQVDPYPGAPSVGQQPWRWSVPLGQGGGCE